MTDNKRRADAKRLRDIADELQEMAAGYMEKTELEGERLIMLDQAAAMLGVSMRTAQNNWGHLLVRISPRRQGMQLKTIRQIIEDGKKRE